MFSIKNSGIKWFNGILSDERVGIYVQHKSDKIILGFKKEFKQQTGVPVCFLIANIINKADRFFQNWALTEFPIVKILTE